MAPDGVETAAETAGAHLSFEVPTASASETLAEARSRLVGRTFVDAGQIHVVDGEGRLEGIVAMSDFLGSSGERRVRDVMRVPLYTAHPGDDQERVAGHAAAHGISTVPVTDSTGRFLGAVPALALIEILRREHVEDIHRLAGIRREDVRARRAMEAPPRRQVLDRLPWLLVGLVGGMVATFIVSRFEGTLESRVAVAFFIPAIVYLADAIGTQAEAITVRGLSLSPVSSLRHLLAGELSTGFLIGLALAVPSFLAVLAGFRDPSLALAVAITIVAAGTVATTIGLLLPWILSKLGTDPAFGSGPVATVIQDVLSLLIYLVVIEALVV